MVEETLQTILASIWQFIADHYQWIISGILIPIILFWLSQRGKKIALEERVVRANKDDTDEEVAHRKNIELEERRVEAYVAYVDDKIAHHTFIHNLIRGVGPFGYLLAWVYYKLLLRDEDDE